MPQGLAGLDVRRVDRNARDGAYLYALGFIKVPYALRAFVRINLIDFWPQKDGLVRAFGLADIAIDALIGDQQCHKASRGARDATWHAKS